MKIILFLAIAFMIACNSNDSKKEDNKNANADTVETGINTKPDSAATTKTYANERFRNVTVEKLGENKFRIKGQAQIFEASFSWVIEDGHDEIKSGFQMTDAGAPEWGNFDFTVEAEKTDPASTLHIILFESSAKDGSRIHQLPILLY